MGPEIAAVLAALIPKAPELAADIIAFFVQNGHVKASEVAAFLVGWKRPEDFIPKG